MNDGFMNNLLIPEPPLQCTPSLAVELGGSDPAIILQQIHYWLLRSNQVKDGHRWVYNSVRQWHEQFPWMSEKTISRHLKNLEKRGLLITGNYNRAGFDKTKWYRINYPALSQMGKPLGQNVPTIGTNVPNGLGQNVPTQEDNLSEPIPIDYTENIQENPPQEKEEEEKVKKYKKALNLYQESNNCELNSRDEKRLISMMLQLPSDVALATVGGILMNTADNPVGYLFTCIKNASRYGGGINEN